MEHLEGIMKKLGRNMIYHSSQCETHNISNMVIDEKIICPRCEKEKADQELSKKISAEYAQAMMDQKYNTLLSKSILEDKTLLAARIDNYLVSDLEEIKNKQAVSKCVQRYKAGEKFNLILQGKQGTGKSHLGYATLFEINETRSQSCCFVSVDAMIRKIKGTFNDKESKYTEDYFIRLLSEVDFLVLDDLGAETGAIDSDKKASDFVQRVLYGATNARQDKSTIITTNLGGETFINMYDKKLISRLLKNPEFIIFKETKDKRQMKLPF